MLENPFGSGSAAENTGSERNGESNSREPRGLQADLDWCKNLAIVSGGKMIGQAVVISGVSYRTVVIMD